IKTTGYKAAQIIKLCGLLRTDAIICQKRRFHQVKVYSEKTENRMRAALDTGMRNHVFPE
ncbi:MAG: hypothetical protein Q4C61_07180, partial [Lachnospiraceae bacterium]|nr:hypothetical protein [Lachnospiraceae bacterium]